MPQFRKEPLTPGSTIPCDLGCGKRATVFVTHRTDRKFRSFRCDDHDNPATSTARESELVDCADDAFQPAQVA